jgi:hypothetical protein
MPPIEPVKTDLDPVFTGQQPTAKPVSTGAYNVLNNQQYVPSQTTSSTGNSTAKLAEQIEARPKSIIRTYQGDMASAIEKDHLSSINIAIAENDKMRQQIQTQPAETIGAGEYSKSRVLIFVSLLLILIGVGAMVAIFIFRSPQTTPTVSTPTIATLITAEFKDELKIESVATNRLANVLSSRLNDLQIPSGNFYSPYLMTGTSSNQRSLTALEFITLAGLKTPDLIKRALQPSFMIGTYSLDKNLPFLILKTSAFENTYAGMLEWEKDLLGDFEVLFRLAPLTGVKFEDKVIINKDVRLIRDADQKIVLLYSLADKETVIITTSDLAFREIVNRLNKEKGLQR